jgi:multiple sugar transport system substrate-binding protein
MVFSAAMLFAAGGQEEDGPGDVTTLRVWSWLFTQGEGPVLRELVEEFDESREDLVVEIMETPWNQARDQILVMSQAGDMPDLIGVNRNWLLEFISLEMIEDLTPFVEQVPGLRTQFFEAVRGEYDGRVWVMPYSGGNSALVYNKTLLDELGLEPPTTMDQFVEIGRQIADPSSNRYATQFGISEANTAGANVCNIGPILYSFGGSYVENERAAFNSPEGVAALEWMIELERSGIAAPGSTTVDARGMREVMAGNIAAMTFDGAWGTPFYNNYPDIEIGIAPMPRGENVGTVVNIANWGIAEQSENKEEAWDLLAYLMEPDNMLRLFREANAMPIIPEYAELPEFSDKAGFLETLAQSDNYFQTGSVPRESELYRIIVQAYQEAFLGAKSPQEALDDAADAYNEILDEFYAQS